jgi:hypothetical protein
MGGTGSTHKDGRNVFAIVLSSAVYLQSGVCTSGFTVNKQSRQKFFLVLLGASRGCTTNFLQITSAFIPVNNQPVSWKLFLSDKERNSPIFSLLYCFADIAV